MRLFIVFSIWMITGLGATSALSATLEHLLLPAGESQQAAAYVPPVLTSSGFVVQAPDRS